MKIDITIQRQQQEVSEPPTDEHLRRFITHALLPESKDTQTHMTLRLVDEAESQELNFRYRNKNYPTNVLAFPYQMKNYLGDLVICVPIVNNEAKEQEKTLLAHWAHMVVHGMLHLQGYDHQNPDEATAMEMLEVAILKKLNFSNPYV